jgi:hypothetical protein
MSRPDTRDTDLKRIESALADGHATADDPRERELQELALALRADSPEATPEFARELDRRMAAGFGKPRRRLSLPSFWMPVFAGAAALILVAVVAISSLGGSERTGDSASVSGRSATGGAASSSAPPSGAPLFAGGRRVERSVELTIGAPPDKLQAAADGIGTVAESHRGFVLSSHVNTGVDGSGGTFTLRVPQRELQATIADISKLGHLRARSESGQDMTAPYNAVQNKLGNALLERRTLKLRLGHAKGAKADAIRARLATLNAAIDGLNGRMSDLKRRTAYSTVNVMLEEEKGESGGTGAAWDDARHTLEGMLTFTIRALGVLLPLALLAALAAMGARTLRRRRREAPLL